MTRHQCAGNASYERRAMAATFTVEPVPEGEYPATSPFEWRIRVHFADGSNRVLGSTLSTTRHQADALHQKIDSCFGCRMSYLYGGPSHDGSMNCPTGASLMSGGSLAHCPCETCDRPNQHVHAVFEGILNDMAGVKYAR